MSSKSLTSGDRLSSLQSSSSSSDNTYQGGGLSAATQTTAAACNPTKRLLLLLVLLQDDELVVTGDTHLSYNAAAVNGRIRASQTTINYLNEVDGLGCTWLEMNDSVELQNKKILYQRADVTEEHQKRPRPALLSI